MSIGSARGDYKPIGHRCDPSDLARSHAMCGSAWAFIICSFQLFVILAILAIGAAFVVKIVDSGLDQLPADLRSIRWGELDSNRKF
jgi:hypothetical protein